MKCDIKFPFGIPQSMLLLKLIFYLRSFVFCCYFIVQNDQRISWQPIKIVQGECSRHVAKPFDSCSVLPACPSLFQPAAFSASAAVQRLTSEIWGAAPGVGLSVSSSGYSSDI